MALFQKSVQNDYLNRVQDSSIKEYWEYYDSYFNNPEQQKLIEGVSERKFYSEFISKLFGKCLGYNTSLSEDQNYFIEEKNETDSGKADGAVKVNGEVVAVMEFKDTTTKNLKDVESQAFGYKVKHSNKCKYVVTCNFKELWFYIDNTTSKEPFNLFNLSYDDFKLLWLCLSYESISTNLPEQIKNKSISDEKEITQNLYKDYSQFRNEIFNDLVDKNPQFDKLLLFKKTQKLLDRFLFIFFAEDRLLLPTNSIAKIIKKWEDDIAYGEEKSLYTTFVFYFNLLNKGRPASKEREEIFAYNGGLFAPDEMLDSIVIDDELLSKHTKKLSSYDFISDVSVNILGHIFEHSLSQIEEIQNEIAGIETDKSKSKRKKDGVFYTPAYITKYIVENTVGKLCKEKREELEFNEAEFAKDRKGRQKNTLKKLSNQLDNYRDWLLGITICDPACGSGAFLVEALNFLIDEHKYIDELRASLFGESIQFSDITASILENNLYGVDINDESVEIAKLSLWLRTAQKGRKLTSLSDNLKCGNSLIDDPEVAGDKAFNWENEFPEVFAKGGFDVIIGNPPYVRHELITDIKSQLEKEYSVYQSIADLYVYFIEKGIEIVKEKGVLGYITPNKFIQSTYAKKLRKYIGEQYQILLMIDFGELPVFSDAATFPLISILKKEEPSKTTSFVKVKSLESLDLNTFFEQNKISIDKNVFTKENWQLISVNEQKLFNKIVLLGTELNKYLDVTFYRGILTGYNEAFIIDNEKRLELISKDPNSKELIKPFVDGDDVRRYHLRTKGKFLIFTRRGIDIEAYPAIKEHLFNYYERLKPKISSNDKVGRKKGDYQWFEIQDSISYYEEFEKDKIIYPEIAKESRFTLDETKTYLNKTIFLIPSSDKFLLALLNSKVIWFYLMNVCTSLGDPKEGGRLNLQKVYLEKTPIVDKSNKEEINNFVTNQLSKLKELQSLNKNFLELISNKYSISSFSIKLKKWSDFAFGDFLKELEKARKKSAKENESEYGKLSLSEESEWMQYFNEQKQKAEELKLEIDKTDNEIDQMVYELYGLTLEEIEIVENATK